MAMPSFISPSERDWLFKSTKELSKNPELDQCLIALFIGTPCTTLELNRIQLKDALFKNGNLKKNFSIRGKLSFNGDDREIYLSSRKLVGYLEAYLEFRELNKVGLGDNPDHFRGLDPDDALLFNQQGKPFSIVKKITEKGTDTYSSDVLNRYLKKVLNLGGLRQPSILSGRRTFATMLKRKGIDIGHIHHLLGNKDLKTTRKLIDSDPLDMGAIAAGAF